MLGNINGLPRYHFSKLKSTIVCPYLTRTNEISSIIHRLHPQFFTMANAMLAKVMHVAYVMVALREAERNRCDTIRLRVRMHAVNGDK